MIQVIFTYLRFKQITKFGSGEYLEIDIPLIVDEKDCNDK
jgi:hypothetical protein